ncbi:MAG TPA: PAS domain-containing protein, partial [Albitalea sp.]
MPNHPGAWAALASLSADLMALLDARGRIVWVNSAFESTSGHGASAVIGRPLVELLAVAGDTTPWPRVGEALAWGRAVERVELPWRHPGGGTRWGALAAQPVDDGPARLAVCLQDLSEPRRLAELVETAQEFGRLGMWERRIPSGEGRWGPQVFRFFGLDPRDGTPPFEAVRERIHPEDRDRVDYDGSTRRPGRYQARYRVLLPDGRVQRIHSQWEVKAAPCGAPERAVGIMVDDTETYQLAQDFNDTTEQLRLAVDLGNIAIWRHDLRTNRLHYNYRAYQVLDIPPRPEGLSLDEVRAVIHPEDLPRAIAAATTALTVDHPVDMEARYRRPDGSWRHVQTRRLLRRDAAGEPLEFVGVALDVTDQVEKSRRVNELAQRLEIATHAAGLGIFTREADSVRPEWNTEMFRLMGRAPELGVPPVDEWLEHIVHPDDRARMARSRERLLHLRDAASEEQYRVVWPGGEVRWLLNRERRVLRNGRATIFGITIDVTERVRTEAALHGATERVALT